MTPPPDDSPARTGQPVPPAAIRFEDVAIPRDADVVSLVNIVPRSFEPLQALKHLREIRLDHTDPHTSPVGLPLSLEPLQAHGELEVLLLPRQPVRDLAPLRSLPRLRELDVSFTPVTDVRPLEEATALQVLRLRASKVRSLPDMQRLGALRFLDVAHTAVTDLTPLAEARSLEELFLDGTAVADLRPLHGLLRLRMVNVSETRTTKAQRAALRAAVPGLSVVG